VHASVLSKVNDNPYPDWYKFAYSMSSYDTTLKLLELFAMYVLVMMSI
jgi:hypothetical protein